MKKYSRYYLHRQLRAKGFRVKASEKTVYQPPGFTPPPQLQVYLKRLNEYGYNIQLTLL